MTLTTLLIFALATWRISSLIFREDGPWKVLAHIRTVIGSVAVGQELLACIWCISVWVGLILTPLAFWQYGWIVALPFALSGAAILLDKAAIHD